MLEFLKTKLWDPMITRSGYNSVNTSVIAILFVLAVEAYWRFFAKKHNQKTMRRSLTPYMIFGGIVRFLDSRAFSPNVFTITPFIFVWILLLFTLLFHFFGDELTEKTGWLLTVLSLFVSLFYLRFSKILFIIPALILTYLFSRLFIKISFMKDGFVWIPHIFEAWITSFGVLAGLVEEHVLANVLMGTDPLLFGITKTLMIPLILYLLKDTEKKQRTFIGTIIASIGIGPGIRDLLELLSL